MKPMLVIFGFVLLISFSKACNDTYGAVTDGQGKECKVYASVGFCQKNPRWMNKNCRRTCNACDKVIEGCIDHHENTTQCQEWASQGECELSARWMKLNCQKSCNACSVEVEGCVDHYGIVDKEGIGAKCDEMAKKGECNKNNANWMQTNCGRSCYSCFGKNLAACKNTAARDYCPYFVGLGDCTNTTSPRHTIAKHACRRTCKLCDQPLECQGDTAESDKCADNGSEYMKDFICIRRPVACCDTCKDWRGNNSTTKAFIL